MVAWTRVQVGMGDIVGFLIDFESRVDRMWQWMNMRYEKKKKNQVTPNIWVTRRMGFAIYSGSCHQVRHTFGFIGSSWWINGSWSLDMLSLRCCIDVQVEVLRGNRLYKLRGWGMCFGGGWFGEMLLCIHTDLGGGKGSVKGDWKVRCPGK